MSSDCIQLHYEHLQELSLAFRVRWVLGESCSLFESSCFLHLLFSFNNAKYFIEKQRFCQM